ncbi:MAG: signal peptidase I, partial [Anaerolineae bacterium]|nr:signal peptidase I [Anaerolineae bacterium]
MEDLNQGNVSVSTTEPKPTEEATAPPQPGTGRRAISWLREVLETVFPAVLIALFIHLFLAQATRVYGQSMEPNLHTEQRLVVEKLSYRFHGPRRGDIVVLRLPEHSSELLIKRVIALPGEKVEIHDGQVYVDSEPLLEPYLRKTTLGNYAARIVPPLHVFVLGDNRNASNDSRAFGPVPRQNIIGRAWFSYWP